MNNTTAIILAVIVAALTWSGILCRRQSRQGDAQDVAKAFRYMANLMFVTAAIIVVVFVANLAGIPNPFAPRAPESAPPAPGLVIDSDKPIVVPPTNADPDTAAQRNQALLEEAKRQQQEALRNDKK